MTTKSLSHTRLNQFHQLQARLGNDFEKAMTAHRAPYQLRVLTWAFSKVVNVAMAIACMFQTPTRGDLSLLEFELMALGYFLPLKSVVEYDAEVVRLSEKQKTVLADIYNAGLVDNPDEKHPLVVEYVNAVNEAEALVQRVHAAYRCHVVLDVVHNNLLGSTRSTLGKRLLRTGLDEPSHRINNSTRAPLNRSY